MHFITCFLSLCYSVVLVSAQFSTSFTSDAEFRATVMAYTNAYRSQHGVPSVIWNGQLAAYAQTWTNRCYWAHSNPTGGSYGENLSEGYQNASAGIVGWANERRDYDYAAGQFGENTGHFTQLVWKSSQYMGCARTYCGGTRPDGTAKAFGWFVACEYYPRGNEIGNFIQNVLPPTY